MKTIKIFISSSVVEFEAERRELGDFILSLNQSVYHRMGVDLQWENPEVMSKALSVAGRQKDYSRCIKESQLFFLLVGRKFGMYTEHEFDVALEQRKKTNMPKIFTWFLIPSSQMPDDSVVRFWNRLRHMGQYPRKVIDINELKLELLIELSRELSEFTPTKIQDADYALDQIATCVRNNNTRAKELIANGLIWDTIPQIVELYEESVRLVKKYHVESDTVYDYAVFLYNQCAYPEAVDLLNWLGMQYAAEGKTTEKEAKLLNLLGMCYAKNNQFDQAEILYRKALGIRRRLMQDNYVGNLPDIADTCNNLGILLSNTNRMDEAESVFREALDIRRKLAQDNPATYLPDVEQTLNNLGALLSDTNRMDEAELAYREALDIRRKLARDNPAAYSPALAITLNNLGVLLSETNRIEEAEAVFREALEIRRKLAQDNPSAYEPYVAQTLNNLGALLSETNRIEEAEAAYREALDIRRKLAQDNPSAYEPYVAVTITDIANLAAIKGDYATAKDMYQNALSIFEKYPFMIKSAIKCAGKMSQIDAKSKLVEQRYES